MYRFPIMQRHPLRWFHSSVCPNRNNRRTKPDYRLYRSSRVGWRFGRNGGSGFASGFRLRHWCGCVLAPKVRSCRDRYRYRYICRPKQIWFLLRGRLKLLRFSDGLCLSFCPRHCSCTPKFLSYHLF